MGDKSPFPVCKTCGKPHRGTCANPEAGGYLSQKVGVIAHVDHRKTSLTAAISKVIADNPGAFVPAALVDTKPSKSVRAKAARTRSTAPKAARPSRGQALSQDSVGALSPDGPVDTTTRGTPRQRAPKGTFDRKEYQRVKAAERRAKKKANPDGA